MAERHPCPGCGKPVFAKECTSCAAKRVKARQAAKRAAAKRAKEQAVKPKTVEGGTHRFKVPKAKKDKKGKK